MKNRLYKSFLALVSLCSAFALFSCSIVPPVENVGIKFINYGSYPQTHVGDEALIVELNKLTETNDRGYYEFNGIEYAKVITTPCNYGTITNKDEQGNMYYITFVYSDGMIVYNNVVEWFVVEPIKWRVLSENSDGSYQVYSEYILDTIVYFDGPYLRSINEVDVYRNNYKYSNVRAWLNGYNGADYYVDDYTNKGFYDLAFKKTEQAAVLETEVDNSASTPTISTNPYACENTFDKIYLLSYEDLMNANYGFKDDLSRRAKVTDYAKAVGAYWEVAEEYVNNDSYWLRSPSNLDNNRAYFVQIDGNITNYYVKQNYYGVRVACSIKLE